MKKVIAGLLVLAIGLSSTLTYAKTLDELKQEVTELKKKATEKFVDVDKNGWYLENVALLTEMAVIIAKILKDEPSDEDIIRYVD